MKKIRTFKRGAATILAVDDPLMEEVSAALAQDAGALMGEGNLRLVVDLGSVPYIDSSALETLLDLSVKAEEVGGGFCVASPNALCRDILAATRLDKVILIYPSLDEACRSFL